MSSAINFTQNSLSIPSYNSRQQQIYSAERKITQIDRQIANNDDRISITKEMIANNSKLIANNSKLSTALKESRDIEAKLLACYEKLLEIRMAKNISNNTTVIVPQKLQASVVSSSNHNSSVKALEKYEVAPVIQKSKPLDMAVINADATQKLGDVLFDNYKGNNQTLATNIRDRFFQELGYDPSKNIASVNSSLEKVFNSFANYLKIGEYSYLNGNNSFLTDLQNRLLSCNVEC